MGRRDHEPVTRLLEPFLEPVRHLARGADEKRHLAQRPPAAHVHEVARRRVLSRLLHDPVADGLEPGHRLEMGGRQRFVQGVCGKVEVQGLGEEHQGVERGREPLDVGRLVLGDCAGLASDAVDGGADRDLIGVPPRRRESRLHVAVDRPAEFEARVDDEEDLAPARRELAPPPALPGLDDHRPALGGPRHGERSTGSEPLALVLESVHLVRIREAEAVPVVEHGAILPGVPVAEHDFHELVGAVVAEVVRRVLGAAEIRGLGVVQRGDHVPGRSPAGHVVEGGEHPGDVKGLEIGRRVGAAKAEPARREPHRGHQGDEIELDHPDPLPERLLHVVAVAVGHREAVVEEGEVELAGLQGAGDALEVLGREEVARGVRVAPRSGVVRAVRRLEKGDELHLARRGTVRRGHGGSPFVRNSGGSGLHPRRWPAAAGRFRPWPSPPGRIRPGGRCRPRWSRRPGIRMRGG